MWGLLTSGSLLVGAVVAETLRPGRRAIGLVLAFGAGALMSAVAYDLVLDAFESERALPALGLAAGALAFFVGDELLDRRGGHGRKGATGQHQTEGDPVGIVLGTVLDGVPESIILGATLVEGGAVSAAFIVAVFVSNVPESMSATSGLLAAGWSRARVLGMWVGVVAVSVAAAAAGYAVYDTVPQLDATFVLAFAAGAMLVMLADTMMPHAFEYAGRTAGLMTTFGFALTFALVQLE